MTKKFKSMYFLVWRCIRPFDANNMKRKIRRLSCVPKVSTQYFLLLSIPRIELVLRGRTFCRLHSWGGGHSVRKLNPAFLRLDRADIQPSRKNVFLPQTLLMCLCSGTTVAPLEAGTAFLPN